MRPDRETSELIRELEAQGYEVEGTEVEEALQVRSYTLAPWILLGAIVGALAAVAAHMIF